MLTNNYYLYCGVILIGIGAFIVIVQWISRCFFDFPPFGNRNPHDGKSGNALLWLQRILSLFAGGLWLVACFQIYLPVIRDVPQLLSGNYSVAKGIVIGADATAFTIEDTTGRTMEFRWVSRVSSVREGRYVEVAYLDNSKAASLLMVDGIEVKQRRHDGRLLFGIIGILSAGLLQSYVMGLIGNRRFFQRRTGGILVYTYAYAIVLMVMDLWVMSGLIVIVAAICENYYPGMVSAWSWMVCLSHVTALPLFVLGRQRMAIKDGRIVYNSFKKKYKGLIKDITRIELVEKESRYTKHSEIKRLMLKIMMADGEVLLVNDMDAFRNQEFYKQMRMEAYVEENL